MCHLQCDLSLSRSGLTKGHGQLSSRDQGPTPTMNSGSGAGSGPRKCHGVGTSFEPHSLVGIRGPRLCPTHWLSLAHFMRGRWLPHLSVKWWLLCPGLSFLYVALWVLGRWGSRGCVQGNVSIARNVPGGSRPGHLSHHLVPSLKSIASQTSTSEMGTRGHLAGAWS